MAPPTGRQRRAGSPALTDLRGLTQKQLCCEHSDWKPKLKWQTEGAQQIDITPDKFGGNYYLEASTLFRDQNGVDMPAEFIIPNCKVQSNFTFSMASTGDPSTFTFTMDAFPDYTRFNKTKKVLAAIQIIETSTANAITTRDKTASKRDFNDLGEIIEVAEVTE